MREGRLASETAKTDATRDATGLIGGIFRKSLSGEIEIEKSERKKGEMET